ncbi:hypothetical protein EPUS_05449 [Endocarpon pusillum Z07020]|uniref:Uncharacterized protein n=1 Tax=Endocarpon pusillum (strain Z07020 / HMAS-L-300199) TaxID=1263415 RepID=U1HI79_ENDPU|nr:uncharacterized protein EPUS_05449 [Endocarpon pusillum Z07020]ERF69905.1 hypothetical protein EPUS_05449 [Endocarpon pusillum Z07020]
MCTKSSVDDGVKQLRPKPTTTANWGGGGFKSPLDWQVHGEIASCPKIPSHIVTGSTITLSITQPKQDPPSSLLLCVFHSLTVPPSRVTTRHNRRGANADVMLQVYLVDEIVEILIVFEEYFTPRASQGLQHLADEKLASGGDEERVVVRNLDRGGHVGCRLRDGGDTR